MPHAPISVRVGTREDIPYIDGLQKNYRKALGFFPRAQLEGYIDNGWVLIAEGVSSPSSVVSSEEDATSAATDYGPLTTDSRLGYVASRDRYLKRDELGVIYQLCVSPSAQRGLIGASLIKAMFERSAYGCRLYCCWCAQDLAANRFWESLGFVPIAFRGGSAKKSRTHIFWQKRVRANDATPWWYPSETGGGAIRENRLVLPIPPGVAWSDAMPVLMPVEVRSAENGARRDGGTTMLKAQTRAARLPASSLPTPHSALSTCSKVIALSRPSFTAPAPVVPVTATEIVETPKRAREKKLAKEKSKTNDPALVKKARELRDRWVEHVNAGELELAPTRAKYQVTCEATSAGERGRAVIDAVIDPVIDVEPVKLLAA